MGVWDTAGTSASVSATFPCCMGATLHVSPRLTAA